MSINVRARVRLEIEIDSGQAWNDACTLDQVRKEAAEGAIARLSRRLHQTSDVRIVGQPEVTMLWSVDKK